MLLIIDTGGGKDGLHLSLEFALLMHRHQIEVYVLRQYFTRALMPLDRDVHREMQLSWAKLRAKFAGEHGHTVASPFQALALIREAWDFSTSARFIGQAWKATGIYPWDTDELLVHQAPVLFKAQHGAAKDHKFLDQASPKVLTLPNSMMERKGSCTKCKAVLLLRHRFCCECGEKNADFDASAAVVMKEGRRSGHQRVRATDFCIEDLVKDGLESLKPCSTAGMAALANASSSSSSSSSDDEKPDVIIKAPVYDAPVVLPSMVKTSAGQKKAWTAVLADIPDSKDKQTMLLWLPDFVKKNKDELMKKYKKGTTVEAMTKDLLDNVSAKSGPDRIKWFNTRVELMKKDLESMAAKRLKSK